MNSQEESSDDGSRPEATIFYSNKVWSDSETDEQKEAMNQMRVNTQAAVKLDEIQGKRRNLLNLIVEYFIDIILKSARQKKKIQFYHLQWPKILNLGRKNQFDQISCHFPMC
jgi:hypothetical protein